MLDTTSDDKDLPTFATKNWIEVYHQPQKNYNITKEIRIQTQMLWLDIFDFSDAYIVVKRTIIMTKLDNAKRNNNSYIYKQCTIYQLHFKS